MDIENDEESHSTSKMHENEIIVMTFNKDHIDFMGSKCYIRPQKILRTQTLQNAPFVCGNKNAKRIAIISIFICPKPSYPFRWNGPDSLILPETPIEETALGKDSLSLTQRGLPSLRTYPRTDLSHHRRVKANQQDRDSSVQWHLSGAPWAFPVSRSIYPPALPQTTSF